ncbi:amino acid ABC transporter permease [Lichenifustis flavocetrariae]|uniref:Amino acid ABC transporter permease n=1 Tax=Lichenifustis flavocetrariae TaxID=2949735 RepID=A0AA41Z123_9HYPH|nr:amino acid ABC transporter permease [Lichenifustis flavocetrariae]MCW6510858.1 amino acid ABC transporter permease [Lichenifustis flavocetrariae]
MTFDLGFIAQHLPEVIEAAGTTLMIWAAGAFCGLALGFLVALGRRYGPAPLAVLLGVIVELLRGTPFLVQLFLLYFGGPFIGLSLDPIPAGVLGLTCYAAAYYSEILRAGFDGVPAGHVEAAACVGFSGWQTIRRIILPEMAVLVMPALVNMTILLLKETAVLSIITVPELTMVTSAIGSESYAFVEALFLLALFYWVMVEICGHLGRFAELRLARTGLVAR